MRSLLRRLFSRRQPFDRIESVEFVDDTMRTRFVDGRVVELPLSMFPRLSHGTLEERNRWRLIGPATGIHWPDLDEDISAEGILERKPSLEGEGSFRRWLAQRAVRQESI
jgi:Protein of unknown function (DUF2442)